jgi:micrococcal nuclease
MKKLLILLPVSLILLGAGCNASQPSAQKTATPLTATSSQQVTTTLPVTETPTTTVSAEQPASTELYAVTSVTDGDTIKVNINGKIETLRLIGIDTPETVDPRKVVQCFGKEASTRAKALLTGKKVRLEADSSQNERDKYDRLLRYVFIEDGTFYNQVIIEEGYAHEYTYDLPYKYQAEFKAAEKRAREAGKGLWAADTCNGDTTQAAVTATPAVTIPTTPAVSTPVVTTPAVAIPVVTTPVVETPATPDEPVSPPQTTCCKYCTNSKACGDSCISKSYTCHKDPGCACNTY